MTSHPRVALTRRSVLAGAAASGALLGRGAWAPGNAAADASGHTSDPWRQAELIVDRLASLGDTPERRRRERVTGLRYADDQRDNARHVIPGEFRLRDQRWQRSRIADAGAK